jgi:hypothetical protein
MRIFPLVLVFLVGVLPARAQSDQTGRILGSR